MKTISAVALFCEDIREEKSGADILVGIYLDNALIEKFPAVLPKLCIYIRLNVPTEIAVSGNIPVRLQLPNNEAMPLGDLDAELIKSTRADSFAQNNPLTGIISKVTFVGFNIPQAGRLQVILTINGEDILCGSINFQSTPVSSSAKEQRSVQSPDASQR